MGREWHSLDAICWRSIVWEKHVQYLTRDSMFLLQIEKVFLALNDGKTDDYRPRTELREV
jgi:hypothetical protein